MKKISFHLSKGSYFSAIWSHLFLLNVRSRNYLHRNHCQTRPKNIGSWSEYQNCALTCVAFLFKCRGHSLWLGQISDAIGGSKLHKRCNSLPKDNHSSVCSNTSTFWSWSAAAQGPFPSPAQLDNLPLSFIDLYTLLLCGCFIYCKVGHHCFLSWSEATFLFRPKFLVYTTVYIVFVASWLCWNKQITG